jgi:anti-sigma B factor antagonist
MQAREQEIMSDTDSADFGVETIEGDEPGVIIAVRGQADLHTAPQLREAMTNAIDGGATSLIVDLSDATFVDSMTLGVLLGAVKRLRPHGGKVAVVCVSPHIRRIFEITLLDRVFALHETLDDAQRAARSRG